MGRTGVNVKKFIHEVEKRPAIWDTSCPEYSDRKTRKQAWDELVSMFIGVDNPSVGERSDFGQKITTRWKSLRDCYARALKSQQSNRNDSDPWERPQYIYYKQMSFLQKIMSKGATNSVKEVERPSTSREHLHRMNTMYAPNINEQQSENETMDHSIAGQIKQDTDAVDITEHPVADDFEDHSTQDMFEEDAITNDYVEQTYPVARRIPNVSDSGVQCNRDIQSSLEPDSDRLFLLSLLKPLKQIPETARFKARLKLMEVVADQLSACNELPTT